MKSLSTALSLVSTAAMTMGAFAAPVAPKPLYRDPVYDGAADVSIVYDRKARLWKMFYTNRRATMHLSDPEDVAWVHGTRVGIATSPDGFRWSYQGTAALPEDCTSITSWAPEVYYERGTYHMWLTAVPGIFHRWAVPGAEASIVHLTSKDLSNWTCDKPVALGAARIIDASVARIGKTYRMWYKDENAGSLIMAADSTDLQNWTKVPGGPVSTTRGEGPKAFRFKGHYWLIADAWKGLMVLRSDDALNWTQQEGFILAQPGRLPTDTAAGQHPDVVVNSDRAFIYYFVHQMNEPETKDDPRWHQRTVIQVAELKFENGKLRVDREARVRARLKPPRD